MQTSDILILSNGPGELATWVKPFVQTLRQQLGKEAVPVRISVVLSPCPNATGKEAEVALTYPEVDRVQSAQHFFPFLLWGRTAENWDWHDRGVVVFLGGDQFYPVIIGKRLGYRTVIYAEWEARWLGQIDRFAVMKPELAASAHPKYAHKFTVVGDLMAEAGRWQKSGTASGVTPRQLLSVEASAPLVGILPGSKAGKLAQGVPLFTAISERIHAVRPDVKFVVLVAPTLELTTLAEYADPQKNPVFSLVEGVPLELILPDGNLETIPYLKTASGLKIELWTQFPAYDVMAQCDLCLTTVGANTAELGALAVPMIVVIPTNQVDAMRNWDGIPGILANLPGVGSLFARMINRYMEKRLGLLAWPNIWAGRPVVPELLEYIRPQRVADLVLDYLDHPEKLVEMRENLRQVRGEPGAATKLAQIVIEELS